MNLKQLTVFAILCCLTALLCACQTDIPPQDSNASPQNAAAPETTAPQEAAPQETAPQTQKGKENNDMPLVTKVKLVNGTPRLFLNDELTVPTLFFGNTDIGTNVTEQAALVADAGIHLHSVIYNLNFDDDYTDTNSYAYQNLRFCMDQILKGDPDAKIFLRVNTGAFANATALADADWRKDQLIQYTNGNTANLVSTASDRWAQEAELRLKAIVEYLHTSTDYRDHLACIHLEKGEWFEYGFREEGSDVSPVNDTKFREWLTKKYQTDAAFQVAWASDYPLSGAAVPRDLPNNISSDNSYPNTLLLKDTEQRYIDYLDYISDLVSDRIDRLGAAVKEASNGEVLVIAFYGYLFELSDAQSGHYNMQKLLRSDNIDGFAAPVSYDDRTGKFGGAGASSAYMTAVDSVTRHGKLWFQESDQRTNINNSPKDSFLPPLTSLSDIYEVHKREIGMGMVHSNGTWAMDLMGTGWLADQSIWDNLKSVSDVFQKYTGEMTVPAKFETVLVIDEKAESVAGQPSYNVSMRLLSQTRHQLYRAGISAAFAEMQDVLDGLFDDAKLYIFVNPYRISGENAKILADKLHRDGKTAVFLYGFGSLSPSDIKLLCGMEVISESGSTNIRITESGKSAGFAKPKTEQTVTPRYSVTAGAAEIYGEYTGSGGTAIALHDGGSWKAVFYGGTLLESGNIRGLAKLADINVFCDTDDILVANDTLAVFCAAKAGTKTITFPRSTDVYDYFADKHYTQTTSVTFDAKLGETKYFFYDR